MLKCSYVQSFFDQIYREGGQFKYVHIREHVASCPQCHRDYENWCILAGKFGTAQPLDPPPTLYGSVLRAIADYHEDKNWLQRIAFGRAFPYPVTVVMVFLMVITVFFLVAPPIVDRKIPSFAEESSTWSKQCTVHFELSLQSAHQVALVGDFNGWNKEQYFLTRTASGTWTIDLSMAKGSYQYLFLVDGNRWQVDPGCVERVPDGFGGFNSVVTL